MPDMEVPRVMKAKGKHQSRLDAVVEEPLTEPQEVAVRPE
jgi:hypothetical protein